MSIEWRDLFFKYTEVVSNAEGVDFLRWGKWSDEEAEAIKALYAEKGLRDPLPRRDPAE